MCVSVASNNISLIDQRAQGIKFMCPYFFSLSVVIAALSKYFGLKKKVIIVAVVDIRQKLKFYNWFEGDKQTRKEAAWNGSITSFYTIYKGRKAVIRSNAIKKIRTIEYFKKAFRQDRPELLFAATIDFNTQIWM